MFLLKRSESDITRSTSDNSARVPQLWASTRKSREYRIFFFSRGFRNRA